MHNFIKYFLISIFISSSLFAENVELGDKTALIVIDMQPFFVTRGRNDKKPENIKKVDEIIKTQIAAIEAAKKANIPIVFIEYALIGDTNVKLKKAAKGYDDVKFIKKSTDGMFSNRNEYLKELVSHLNDKHIGKLIITGANGGACVERSISGSLENGYEVISFSKAIADFNYEDFIYPYDDQYEFVEHCRYAKCKFKEVDELEIMVLELSDIKKDDKDKKINNENRGDTKESLNKTNNVKAFELNNRSIDR